MADDQKNVLTKEDIEQVKKKLEEMQGAEARTTRKGETLRLNTKAAAWSVNYTT